MSVTRRGSGGHNANRDVSGAEGQAELNLNGTSTAERPESVRRRLSPQPTSVAEARALVRDLLVESGRDDLVETAALLVSEVVTNALLHAGTPIDVRASLDRNRLRVEVSDRSVHAPVRRRYAATAGTGRGMLMLEQMVDDWGVRRHRDGKTVWFLLVAPGTSPEPVPLQDHDPHRRTRGDTVTVDLAGMPLLLHAAWQEHAEALLREYLLHSLDDPSDGDPIQMHADATDAIAILEEQVPRARSFAPDRLMADATEPSVSMDHLEIEVPVASVPHFRILDDAIEAALELAGEGRIMTPPTQPEVRAYRAWVCRQVLDQAAGETAAAWSVEGEPAMPPEQTLSWDSDSVSQAATGVVAADETSRIIAVSAPALELLGYDDAGQLLGQRLVVLIPERFRQAHVAGLTLYLLGGREPLIGRPVQVPALRRDGSEVLVDLVVTAESLGDGHRLFLADLRAVEQDGPAT